MLKRIGVCLLMLTLAGSACSKKANTGTGDTGGNTSGGGAKSYAVQMDLKKPNADFNAMAFQFFPDKLSVHPGDTVTFNNYSGEPHSVTFGTLVTAGLAKVRPPAGPGRPQEPAELKKVPPMLPEGPGDANPVSANPCFVATGDPSPATCKTEQPAFDGKYSLYSSGFLPEGTDFKMTLASTVAPGVYRWFCTLHREGMMGTLTVAAPSATIPSPASVSAQGQAKVNEYLSKLRPVAAFVRRGLGQNNILAGGQSQDRTLNAQVDEFGPKAVKVKPGQLVKWTVIGFHSIELNASADAEGIVVKGPDGKFHINPKVAAPTKSPPTIPKKPTGNVGDAGTWNGVGFLASGLLPGTGPPGFLTWQVRFSKKGTYKYMCGVHKDMEGTVTVA